MDISKITGYFHDGYIEEIRQEGTTITLWLESSEILPEWGVNVPLSKNRTIEGKLILNDVKKIIIDGNEVEVLRKFYDYGEIFSLKKIPEGIFLHVEWIQNGPISENTYFQEISIYSSNIKWIDELS